MKFLLARKERMTQIFTEDGQAIAGTVLSAAPMTVTQVKKADGKDGYNALQVGSGARRAKNLSKAVAGHLKGKSFAALREFRTDDALDLGAEVKVDTFAVGDEVQVSGAAKGRGFAGVVKRYNFKGGRRSHGQKHSERERGSSGGGPGRAGGRVALGMRMAGRMGGNRVTVKSLKVIAVDPSTNQIIISGAVPGARGTLIEIVGTAK
jgi:large subunit ribosomal protein L3